MIKGYQPSLAVVGAWQYQISDTQQIIVIGNVLKYSYELQVCVIFVSIHKNPFGIFKFMFVCAFYRKVPPYQKPERKTFLKHPPEK